MLEIPANGQSDYEIVYNPDGTSILYNLIGKSTPPGPLQTF